MITQANVLEKSSAATPLPCTEPIGNRPVIVSSDELLQGRRELWIEHGGEMYRLRLTGTGKLYLTK